MQENWHNHIFGTLGPRSSPGAFTSSKQQIISFSLSAKAQCFVILSRCWRHTSCQKEQCETHNPLKYNLLWGKWQGDPSHCGHGLKVGASLRTSNDCGIELVRTVFLTWIFLRGNEIIGVLRCQNETRVLKSRCFIKNGVVILHIRSLHTTKWQNRRCFKTWPSIQRNVQSGCFKANQRHQLLKNRRDISCH